MKNAIFVIILLFISFHSNAQTVSDGKKEIQGIPAWVKEKVTPEEYKMWETVSSVLNVDYSFLKKDLTPVQKERLYKKVKKICLNIEAGKYKDKIGMNIIFVPTDINDPNYKGEPVPEWVKNKVTAEEYELLSVLNSLFKVDYSFIDEITYLDEKERADFTSSLKKLANNIQTGNLENKRGTNFIIALSAQVDTDLDWEYEVLYQIDEHIQFCKRKAAVYTAEHLDEAKVYLEVWYVYDSAKKEVNIVSHKMSSSMPMGEFHGGASLQHWKESGLLQGEFAGVYEYYDKSHKKHWDDVRKGFRIPLE